MSSRCGTSFILVYVHDHLMCYHWCLRRTWCMRYAYGCMCGDEDDWVFMDIH